MQKNSISIDTAKAIAANLILLHHLAIYSPVENSVFAQFPQFIEWLEAYAPMAVQVFLVIGGYLAAASLTHLRPSPENRLGLLRRLVLNRYRRLMPAYFMAASAVLLIIWFSGAILKYLDTPAVSMAQVIANLTLLHDILGHEGLSAGFWYVAIDLQLYAVTCLIMLLCHQLPGPPRAHLAFAALVAGMAIVSLLQFNRNAELDMWFVYFMGAYGLGVLAYFANSSAGSSRRLLCLGFIGLVGGIALYIEWRPRVAVAVAMALLLCHITQIDRIIEKLPARILGVFRTLSHSSYEIFLLHYPVLLLACAVAATLGGAGVGTNSAAIGITWVVSIAIGLWVHGLLQHGPRPRATRLETRPQ